MKLNGFVEAYLTDENGKKKKVYEGKNFILPEFYNALATALLTYDSPGGIALDELFTTENVEDYHDGIIFTGLNPSTSIFNQWMAMVSTTSQPAPKSFRCTGVYNNTSGVTVRVGTPAMGKSWVGDKTLEASGFNDFTLSSNVGWSVLDVPTGTGLTIIWTITFTEH